MIQHVDNPEFAIRNRKEIVFVLEDLLKERAAINLVTSEGVSLQTSVLKVSAEGNYVYLDIGPDNRLNDKIIHDKRVSFSTQSGVTVRWHSTHLHRVSLPDGDAFSMTLPAVVERIQRREYFRLNTPQGSNALTCKIPAVGGIIEATVANMSAEGLCVSVKGELPVSFSQGAQLQGCSIEFPVIGVVSMALRLCGVWSSIQTRSGEEVHRVGMAFVDLSRGANNVVQRYMIELEKDQLNKS